MSFSDWTTMLPTKNCNSLSKLSCSAFESRDNDVTSPIKVAIDSNARASGIPSVDTEGYHVDQANREFVILRWTHMDTVSSWLKRTFYEPFGQSGASPFSISGRGRCLYSSSSPPLMNLFSLTVYLYHALCTEQVLQYLKPLPSQCDWCKAACRSPRAWGHWIGSLEPIPYDIYLWPLDKPV